MSYKEATHSALMGIYQTKGASAALSAAEGIIHSSDYHDDLEFKRDLHGEVCECVLEIILRNFEMKSGVDWEFSKSLVIPQRGKPAKDFLTEIDLVLYSPMCLFLFECKSYAGEKELIGDGYLKRDSGNGCDVYRQSMVHKSAFESWFNEFTLRGKMPVIQTCMFNFSNGNLVDKRSRAAKIEMPCLDADSVLRYVTGFTEPVWDMYTIKQAIPMLESASKKMHEHHLSYVKQLNSRR